MIDAWLRSDVVLRGSVIHERLVTEYEFTGHYQRVKMYLVEARPRIAAALASIDENPLIGLHRRFEVLPGAQAQVDWGDEGNILAHVGIGAVYSFHMRTSAARCAAGKTASAPTAPLTAGGSTASGSMAERLARRHQRRTRRSSRSARPAQPGETDRPACCELQPAATAA